MPRPLDIPGLDLFGDREKLAEAYYQTFETDVGKLVLAHLQLLYRQTPYYPILQGRMANEHLWFRCGQDEVVKNIENYIIGEFDPPQVQTYPTEGGEF